MVVWCGMVVYMVMVVVVESASSAASFSSFGESRKVQLFTFVDIAVAVAVDEKNSIAPYFTWCF